MELKISLPADGAIRAVVTWSRRALAQRRQRHQALQLATMSEHELLDLGIGRSEIPALLANAGRESRG